VISARKRCAVRTVENVSRDRRSSFQGSVYSRPMDGFKKVTAVNDVEKDVHYLSQGTPDTTLCGLKSAGAATGEVTCYRCHQFAVGDI
jgi:hypothetical protein